MTLEKTTAIGVRQAAVFQRFANFEHHFVGVRKMVTRPIPSDHFVGVNKMVPAGPLEMDTGARESEAKIAENVLELLEIS